MNILVCDDNSSIREMIQRMIQQHTSIEASFYFAESFEEAKKRLHETRIDLAFLDIQLSQSPHDAMGLEVGRILTGINPNAEVVMVTSHDDYALLAFEIHPYAYVQKPIDINHFLEVVKGVIAKIERRTAPIAPAHKRPDQGKLFIMVNKEMLWVPYDDILYIEKISKELIIHTARSAHTVRWTLSKIEEMLPEEFLRVHKSYIVNSSKIRRIAEIGDRTYEITFHESNKLALMSRYKAGELFALLNISE